MNWKKYIALLLLLPLWWQVDLPPLWEAIELAEHYLEYGEHCSDHCSHPSSLIDKPTQSTDSIVSDDDLPLWDRRLVVFAPDPHARDRPPPQLIASIQTLRAPPR